MEWVGARVTASRCAVRCASNGDAPGCVIITGRDRRTVRSGRRVASTGEIFDSGGADLLVM